MAEAPIKRALISVTDKTGIVEFAQALIEEFGVEVISTEEPQKSSKRLASPLSPLSLTPGFQR